MLIRPQAEWTNNCCDVAISHLFDDNDNRLWAFHLYKTEMTGAPPPEDGVRFEAFIYPLVSVYQCLGTPKNYRVHITPRHHALNDPDRADRVNVAKRMTNTQVRDAHVALSSFPVDNIKDDYNNQHWVLDAMDHLYDMDLFRDEDYEIAHGIMQQLFRGVDVEDLEIPGDDVSDFDLNTESP